MQPGEAARQEDGGGAPAAASDPFRVRDALQVLFVALLVALFIRTFVLEGYRIPTESMERSLLAGDFVLVSKVHYGPRLPRSVGLPLTEWYVEGLSLPYVRLPGFTDVSRADVVVFNYPQDEGPVDRRVHYVKRVVGLPGDTVALADKVLYVNGERVPLGVSMQQRWVAQIDPSSMPPVDSLWRLGASQVAVIGHLRDQVVFEATTQVAEAVAAWGQVAGVAPYIQDPAVGARIFPDRSSFGRDSYGPLIVPRRGDTLALDAATWPQYKDLITRYEGHHAVFTSEGPRIDSVQTARYVVEQDYYFVLGDNRDSSVDSRVWGFVPADHVVGKAVLVYFSWDQEENKLRMDRLLSPVQ